MLQVHFFFQFLPFYHLFGYNIAYDVNELKFNKKNQIHYTISTIHTIQFYYTFSTMQTYSGFLNL